MCLIKLRDYQDRIICEAREKMRSNRRILLQAPTGAGKTALATFMASTASQKGIVWFVCHRVELVLQTSLTFAKFGLQHGIIAPGFPSNPHARVQICSIDTLKNRLHQVQKPSLIIWDECHHIAAAGWAEVMNAFDRAYHIGLSATPTRLDGSGLDEFFDDMVLGPAVAWLIEQGHLSEYKIFAPPAPDGLKGRAGSDGRNKQAGVLDRPKLTGDVVKHWMKHARGMRTVGFACNVAHSKHMVEAFKLAGISAAHLDGNTPKAERKAIIQAFARGEISVIWNVSLFGEGFDLSAVAQTDVTIDCVILNRRTWSLSLFLQMVGRALRPAPGKVAIILDHAGNTQMHGLPDDDREWTLQGREKGRGGKSDPFAPKPPAECESCYNQIRQPAPAECPHCGMPLRAAAKPIEVEEGELEEAASSEQRRAKRRREAWEQAQCETLQQLVALGHRRGHKSPSQWAYKIWSARKAKERAAEPAPLLEEWQDEEHFGYDP